MIRRKCMWTAHRHFNGTKIAPATHSNTHMLASQTLARSLYKQNPIRIKKKWYTSKIIICAIFAYIRPSRNSPIQFNILFRKTLSFGSLRFPFGASHSQIRHNTIASCIWLPFFGCILCIFTCSVFGCVCVRRRQRHQQCQQQKWICVASLVPPQHWLNFIRSLAVFFSSAPSVTIHIFDFSVCCVYTS